MSICGDGDIQILGVAACLGGWQANFTAIDVASDTDKEPIVCWLLVDHGGDVHVHPVVAFPDGIHDATVAGNYCGVTAPGSADVQVLTAVPA